MFQNRNVMELRFLPPLANGNGNGNCMARDLALERSNAEEQQDEDGHEDEKGLPAVASSSCETLEACDAAIKLNLPQKHDQEQLDAPNAVLEAPSKPLPPLPKKPANGAGQVSLQLRSKTIAHGRIPTDTNKHCIPILTTSSC